MSLQAIQIDTQNNPNCAVIWLHGLGANGHDFEPIVSELNLPDSIRARFIFPHAPVRAVTLNSGIQMPAWYDIYSLEMNSNEDIQGVEKITREIHAMIDDQHQHGIAIDKIVLAGFSQGGALALYAGLTFSKKLSGLMGLSSYLPLRDQIDDATKFASRGLRIFLAHGSYDDVVPMAYAHEAKEILEGQKFTVQWNTYPCAHTVCAEEIQDIRKFLLSCWQ